MVKNWLCQLTVQGVDSFSKFCRHMEPVAVAKATNPADKVVTVDNEVKDKLGVGDVESQGI